MPRGGARSRSGPPPKPSALKVLHGSRLPKNDKEPKPTPQIPACPDELDEDGKEEWRRITPELFKLGLLSQIDRAGLVGYCLAWQRLLGAMREDDWRMERATLEVMHRYLVEYGMTPSSRSRVKVEPKAEASMPEDEAFLAKRGLRVVTDEPRR